MSKEQSPSEAIGIWFNKRALSSIDLAFAHTLRDEGAGWRIDVGAAGDVVVHLRDGGAPKRIQVSPGDRIVGNGDDLYIAVNRPGGSHRDGT